MRKSVMKRLACMASAGALALVGLAVVPQAAQAYDVNTTSTQETGSMGGTTTSLTSKSGITTTLTMSGSGSTGGQQFVLGGTTGSSSTMFTPNVPDGTPMMSVYVGANNSASAGTGCVGGTTCPEGTMTVTFSQPVNNPVMNIVGIGWALQSNAVNPTTGERYLVRSTAGFQMTASSPAGAGVGSVLAGAKDLTVTNGVISSGNQNASSLCNTTNDVAGELAAADTAGCGSVQILGTAITSLTFQTFLTVWNVNSAPSTQEGGANPLGLSFTFEQHYSDAPASYNGSQAPAAVVGGLALGSSVTANATTVADPSASPYVASGAAVNSTAAGEDAVSSWPKLSTASVGDTYAVTVPISGADRTGQVCGYVDFTQAGNFNAAADKACAGFNTGQTSVDLSWTIPSGTKPGTTYARLRANYGTTSTYVSGASSPTGLAGTGEVEDYSIHVTGVPALTLAKTASVPSFSAAGQSVTYSFKVTNTGDVALTDVAATETQFSGSGTMSAISCPETSLAVGASMTCTATYTTTQADVESASITNTANASGKDSDGDSATSTPSTVTIPYVVVVDTPMANPAVAGGVLVLLVGAGLLRRRRSAGRQA